MRSLLALAVFALLTSPADAQQFDRRARDEPEIVIEAGGRVGTADMVRFTPDGKFLLVGGDDKVVRVWPHSASGLDTDPTNTRVLRWRGWRDQLGGVKCFAISPDSKHVAIGGYGLKISSVSLVDRETGTTVAITWPRTQRGDHHDAVTAITFHPDGKRIAFGTADGTLWLWNPQKLAEPDGDRAWNAPLRVGHVPTHTGNDFNFPRVISFPDANTLVAVAAHGEVQAFDLRANLTDDPAAPVLIGRTLFHVTANLNVPYHVFEARWTGDGKWLVAATTGPLVLLRSTDGKNTIRIDLPTDHFPRCLAVHPKTGAIAVGVGSALSPKPGQPRFFMEPDDEIWVYDRPTSGRIPKPAKFPHIGRIEAMGFHPTANQLAIAGGDADEVTLLDLARSGSPISVVRGNGRRLHAVKLSENGHVLAVQHGRDSNSTDPNNRGSGPWVQFNLDRLLPTTDSEQTWIGPLTTANGWAIVPDQRSRFVWHAMRVNANGTRETLRLGLDADIDQAPTCFTFVPTPAGKPQRVLIGHYYGCSLFELEANRVRKNPHTGVMELPRSRLFIGHGAEVLSVVADKTGDWFVTASADQTVAGWSLADWKGEPSLGATFAVSDGQLIVTDVDLGSPAWEAGLSRDDRIDLLAVDGELQYDRRANRSAHGTPDHAAAALAHPQSGIELFFGWTPTNSDDFRATPTRIKQRPLWKWFPAFDDTNRLTDWVIWMWHGSYYHTTSAHGDRFVGWHLNAPDVAGTPRFHSLERYRHLFLRPDVLKQLVRTRSISTALERALGENPRPRSFREVEPAPIDLALDGVVVRPEGVRVTVTVNPRGNNPDLLPERVELWVNDYRFRVWAGHGTQPLRQTVTIPAAAFRSGRNQITAQALNPLRGRAEATRFVTNNSTLSRSQLWGVAVGINDYSPHRESTTMRAFGNLRHARADAVSVAKVFLDQCGSDKGFRHGHFATLLDAKAGREHVIATLADLTDVPAKPDDLLVVFLAGHGDLMPEEKAWGDAGRYVFCCPNYTATNPRDTAVFAQELFDALATINCRKLVLLDTCHAGSVIHTNVLRQLIPHGHGPVVIASCRDDEVSIEDSQLEHGVFTRAVLEALGSQFRKADTNTDGTVSVDELYAYLAVRVPALAREVQPDKVQNPICFPPRDSLPKWPVMTR